MSKKPLPTSPAPIGYVVKLLPTGTFLADQYLFTLEGATTDRSPYIPRMGRTMSEAYAMAYDQELADGEYEVLPVFGREAVAA